MARVHFWQFLINEIGEPIEGANVSIYLAGTETPARVYTDEFSGNVVTESPQLTTLSNGFFQAWIGDNAESHGYSTTQKFKVVWDKVGISHGEIDYVDIFPAIKYIEPVNETDQNSIVKDKTISNQLAYYWEDHINYNVIDHGLPVHGLDLVNTSLLDETPNKLLNNKLAWDWHQHRISTVQTYHPSGGTPHGIEEVDILSNTTLINKLVSNDIINTIKGNITTNDYNIHHVDFQQVYDQTDISGDASFEMSPGKDFVITNNTGSEIRILESDCSVLIDGGLTVNGNTTIDGNLTVLGTTTSIETEQLLVEDNLITLNHGTSGLPTENAGIEIDRGSSPFTSLRWNETNDIWELTSDGTNFYEIHHQGNFNNDSFVVLSSGWSSDGDGGYMVDIHHNFNIVYPFVTIWDTDNDSVLSPKGIESINSNTIRVSVNDSSLNLSVKIIK